ncbi:hypothetical protein CLG96_09785 [Sphingomonas oleivorans]|uniref:Uncharacterized protein n=1 Tax=Sphingomonas oleivorans TaxID=1735121 RepID=A0A2T5FX54_9SPHN|nr:hypothetical protein CLG96_09785 [Sphingomonas oleivorans]
MWQRIIHSEPQHFGVSAVKLLQRVERTGSVVPAPQARSCGAGKLVPYMARPIRWVDTQPDIAMAELSRKLEAAGSSCPSEVRSRSALREPNV